MRYEQKKMVAATFAVLSVGVILWSVLGRFETGVYSFYIAGSAALLSAYVSLKTSRRLVEERDAKRVFLIYAREDLSKAREVAEELRLRGFSPWLDVEEILPGQIWDKAVIQGLEESVAALVLVSKNLDKAGFAQGELKVALNTLQELEKGTSPVIPVRIEEDAKVPQELEHIQWVNLFEAGGFDYLERGLKNVARKT